jgi:hypothetical protein
VKGTASVDRALKKRNGGDRKEGDKSRAKRNRAKT